MPPPTERCQTCKMWVPENGWGQCHRHAPTPTLQCTGETRDQHVEAEPVFPRTPAYEWCGEYVKAT